jgi:hypothetical protein
LKLNALKGEINLFSQPTDYLGDLLAICLSDSLLIRWRPVSDRPVDFLGNTMGNPWVIPMVIPMVIPLAIGAAPGGYRSRRGLWVEIVDTLKPSI